MRRLLTARLLLLWLCLFAFLAGISWLALRFWRPENHGSSSSHSVTPAKMYSTYGGSASCRECHAEQYEKWARSHHALAERLPEPAQEDPAFMPTRTFPHGTQQTTVRGTKGHYELITAGLSGTNEVFPVQRVLAENPLRQMLVPFPGGRLQVTEAAWDPRSNEWFNVYGNEDRKPGEWGHWTGRGMNWNSMCAACHNTRVLKNYDAATDTYHTTMAERAVGCEACHGPLKAHNDWQHAHKNSDRKDPTLRKFTRKEHFSTCAACHSRRAEITGDPVPGNDFFEHHLLSIVDDTPTFYPDGQIQDEDYEVTAFMGSRMYHKGVRCMDCHDVHTMKTKLPGNFLCLQCHSSGATNAPAINPVTHSHHQVFGYDTNGTLVNVDLTKYIPSAIKETGGECVNCHMPQTVYMQRHSRHDHGFTIPDPLLTKQFNIPNACARCHADKGNDWNLKYVEQWYGTNMNRPYRQRAQTITRARQGEPAALEPLIKMLGTDESFYWRAAAANLLQRWCGEPAVTMALLAGLKDTNALVRQTSVQALGPLAQAGRTDVTDALQPLLKDSSRNVRVQAAQLLVPGLDTNSLAGREYLHFIHQMADQPGGQLQLGSFELQRGAITNALAHLQTAAKWDPYSPGIRQELAIVLSQAGRAEEAVTQLEAAVKLAPSQASFHYSLALALNETGASSRMVQELEAAVKCDPQFARAWYNLGLARSSQGDDSGALAALVRAESADPSDPSVPYARATVLARLGKLDEARSAARRALELDPNSAAATCSDNSAGSETPVIE